MTKRKFLTPEQKIAIVREHLLEGIPVSTLVDKHKIHAVQFYQWQKLLFEEGAVVFERKPNGHNVRRQESAKDEKIEQLEAKIKSKNDVMAELLDGFSRLIVHWDIRPEMKEIDIEAILQLAKERYPEARPRIISDNGPQFIANDFKSFIRLSGMTHVRTSPYYPQSNGKLERYHKSLKSECIRPKTPLSLEDAKRAVEEFVSHYNDHRLHSAIGYVTPSDMLEGRQTIIHAERDRKLEQAREERARKRAELRNVSYDESIHPEDRAMLGSNPSAELMSKASLVDAVGLTLTASAALNLPLTTMR